MDAKLFSESIEYEKLTQYIYQIIMKQEGQDIDVQHNVDVIGRSGVKHQIDVYWKFKIAGVQHTVLIECKNYNSSLTLEKVRNFFGVLHDVGNSAGIIVTKTGYQSGAKDFADFYNIDLKLLDKPKDEDWNGKVKNIEIGIYMKSVVSTEDRPIIVELAMRSNNDGEAKVLEQLKASRRMNIPSPATLRFCSASRVPITDELRWWLPKMLDVVSKENGGPYTQRIPLNDSFILLNPGEADETLVQVIGITVTYYVQTTDFRNIAIHGEEVVNAILKDFKTGKVEHVNQK